MDSSLSSFISQRRGWPSLGCISPSLIDYSHVLSGSAHHVLTEISYQASSAYLALSSSALDSFLNSLLNFLRIFLSVIVHLASPALYDKQSVLFN